MTQQTNDGVVCGQGSPRSLQAAERLSHRVAKAIGVVSLLTLSLGAVACGPKVGGTGDKPTTTQGAPTGGGAGGTTAPGGDTSTPPTGTPASPGTAPG